MFEKLLLSLYLPNANYIDSAVLFGNNAYTWIYFILILIFLGLLLNKKNIVYILPFFKKIVFLVIVILCFFQVINQFSYKPADSYLTNSNSIYHIAIKKYAEYCQKKIPQGQKAYFLTDFDISKDPGMLIHKMFIYYLYPVDISNLRQGETKYLILFNKRNAIKFVPSGYEIMAQLDSFNLIAKKNLNKDIYE